MSPWPCEALYLRISFLLTDVGTSVEKVFAVSLIPDDAGSGCTLHVVTGPQKLNESCSATQGTSGDFSSKKIFWETLYAGN